MSISLEIDGEGHPLTSWVIGGCLITVRVVATHRAGRRETSQFTTCTVSARHRRELARDRPIKNLTNTLDLAGSALSPLP